MAASTIEEWLHKRELKFEDKYPKKYISPTLSDDLRIRWYQVVKEDVIGFFSDIKAALKAIYKEIE